MKTLAEAQEEFEVLHERLFKWLKPICSPDDLKEKNLDRFWEKKHQQPKCDKIKTTR